MCPEAEPGASETSRGHQDKKEVLRSLLLFHWLEIFMYHIASSGLKQECMGYLCCGATVVTTCIRCFKYRREKLLFWALLLVSNLQSYSANWPTVETIHNNFSHHIKVNVFWCSFQARSSHQDDCRNFLIDFARSDPAQDFSGQKSELFKGLVQTCRKQTPKTDTVAGSTVDRAVNSTFAALVYLTPALYEKLQKYGNSNIRLS